MFNPIVDGGLIYDILAALGLVADFEITDTYTFLYSIVAILIVVIFLVVFLRVLFKCIASLFRSVGL